MSAILITNANNLYKTLKIIAKHMPTDSKTSIDISVDVEGYYTQLYIYTQIGAESESQLMFKLYVKEIISSYWNDKIGEVAGRFGLYALIATLEKFCYVNMRESYNRLYDYKELDLLIETDEDGEENIVPDPDSITNEDLLLLNLDIKKYEERFCESITHIAKTSYVETYELIAETKNYKEAIINVRDYSEIYKIHTVDKPKQPIYVGNITAKEMFKKIDSLCQELKEFLKEEAYCTLEINNYEGDFEIEIQRPDDSDIMLISHINSYKSGYIY